jgi:hypothetical protein
MKCNHSIALIACKGHSQDTIKRFLAAVKLYHLMISVPKLIPQLDDVSIAMSYYSAAYAGQLLKNISSSFAYYVPSPHNDAPFTFEIKITDQDKLATVLEYLSLAYYSFSEADEEFDEKACYYAINARENPATTDCFGIVTVAWWYMGKEPPDQLTKGQNLL